MTAGLEARWDDVLDAAARLQGAISAPVPAPDRDLALLQAGQTTLADAACMVFPGTRAVTLNSARLVGVDTCIRRLGRTVPLETVLIRRSAQAVRVPAVAEILRLRGILVVRRNALRDYGGFADLACRLDGDRVQTALALLDRLYPQPEGSSVLQQLAMQMGVPRPWDLPAVPPADWPDLCQVCMDIGAWIWDFGFDGHPARVVGHEAGHGGALPPMVRSALAAA